MNNNAVEGTRYIEEAPALARIKELEKQLDEAKEVLNDFSGFPKIDALLNKLSGDE